MFKSVNTEAKFLHLSFLFYNLLQSTVLYTWSTGPDLDQALVHDSRQKKIEAAGS